MDSVHIQDLAAQIAYNVAIYSGHISSNNLPESSHDVYPQAPISEFPDSVLAARQIALEAAHELHELLRGPEGIIMDAAQRSARIMVLHFIKTNKIGFNLAWGEQTTFKQIAEDCGLDEEDMTRMLRLAMTEHIFTEPESGVVKHTAPSYELAQNHGLAAWVGVATEENWPPMQKITEAIRTHPGSQEPMESAYAIAHNLTEPAFQTWEKDPKRIQQFSDAMTYLDGGSGLDPAEILRGVSFQGIEQPVFVDVGGSEGNICMSLARLRPNMRFVVQDTPQTVSLAQEKLPADLHGRVSFEAYDFWTEQRLKNADLYFFKCVLHDWSDLYAVKILRNLVPALKRGARVIIADVCIPPKGVLSSYKENWIRGVDIIMKCFTNAKEREAGDWAALFAKADAGFRFRGVRMSPGSKASLIEAEWQPLQPESGEITVSQTNELVSRDSVDWFNNTCEHSGDIGVASAVKELLRDTTKSVTLADVSVEGIAKESVP